MGIPPECMYSLHLLHIGGFIPPPLDRSALNLCDQFIASRGWSLGLFLLNEDFHTSNSVLISLSTQGMTYIFAIFIFSCDLCYSCHVSVMHVYQHWLWQFLLKYIFAFSFPTTLEWSEIQHKLPCISTVAAWYNNSHSCYHSRIKSV